MKLARAVAVLAWLASAGPAAAFCYAPSFSDDPPDAPGSYERPDVPYCLSSYSYSREHTCSQWELDSYRREVEAYVDQLNDYVRDAATFAREAIDHATAAQRYAECEADDVGSQHE